MQSDLQAYGEITRAQLSERILEDAAPLASYTVVELLQDEDSAIRLRAAQYLLDRANGKPKTSIHLNQTPTNPVMQILDGVVVERPKSATVIDYGEESTEEP